MEKIKRLSFQKNNYSACFLILLVSCSLAALEYMLDGMLSRDGFGYLLYTREALNNGWQAAAERFPELSGYPPLLVMLMYGAGKLGVDYELTGRLLNLLGIIFTGWGVWFIGMELYRDRLMALCAALITVSIPKLYIDGCNILRDPLYWAEMVWACALFFRSINCCQQKIKWDYWCFTAAYSLLGALSCITRKEGFFFCGLLAAAIILTLPAGWKNKLITLLILILFCVLLVCLPDVLAVPWNRWEFIDTWGARWQ